MARICWDWCEMKHKHNYGSGTMFTRRIHMSPEERDEVFKKTGRHVDDKNGMDRALAETGIREAEKGEVCHERFDALLEAAEGKKLDEKHTLAGMDLYGEYAARARKPKFDFHERLKHHRHRLGENG